MIKGILLDSGRVLNHSASGHWFITPKFFDYVDQETFESLTKAQIRDAFIQGLMYIDKQKVILDKKTEYSHFIKCYEIFLDALPILKDRENQAEDLARELVYNPTKFVFYKDARPFLEANKSYKMALVSDAWPSLRDVFIHADYIKYFDSLVISSEIGVCKPNSMMFQQALTDLNLKADEVIFVDDRPKNCLGAHKLGIKSYLLSRHWSNYWVHKFKYRQLTVINSLNKIRNL